jgi:hypothetical protein
MRIRSIVLAAAAMGFSVNPMDAQVGMPYQPGEWHVEVTPYLWAAGLEGILTIGTAASRVDASFVDVAENLDFAFAAHVEASKNTLTLMGDVF